MIELAIASQFANDKMRRQFADPPRRAPRVAPTPTVAEPRAPVRRATVRALRVIANRLEPAPRCVQA